jgi:hypothetical protein
LSSVAWMSPGFVVSMLVFIAPISLALRKLIHSSLLHLRFASKFRE